MTDQIDVIDQAMMGLDAHRRDQVADRKRQALTAIAATLDTWAAAASDDAGNNFFAAITAAATARNKMLIEAEFPKRG